MCGIAGIFGRRGVPLDAELRVRRMLGTIRHRGPDQFGVCGGRNAVLGSARLSIIDLAGGQQPIGTEDGRFWIVYNGEVFNHVELRAWLESRGRRFQTRSDTEVVLQAFAEEGAACLRRFNGQFVIAIYDAVAHELFLARDRLGVRPLFFCERGGHAYFASEIKCLLAGRGERASIDPGGLGHVFTYWSPLPGSTVFDGIRELPAGHWMKWSEGGTELQRYWDCDFGPPDSSDGVKSLDEWKEELKARLVAATRLRLRADVPVGAYLSGGLDSSLLASIVRHETATPLRTFSIAFADERFDEREHQTRMAAFLGTDHEVVEATQADIGRVFPEVVRHTETPLLRTAPAPMFLLSRRVRERGFKVVLTGEGADEFLGGYDIFKEAAVRRFWARDPDSTRRPKLLGRLYPDVFRSGEAGSGMGKAFFGQGLLDTGALGYSHAVRWRNTRRLWRFLAPGFAAAAGPPPTDAALEALVPPAFRQWHPLARAQYLEITLFLTPYLLSSQGDRVAMAHSVEGRHPFLDVRLVEWANRLPPALKLRGLRDKRLLRAVGRDFLPPEIGQRPKRPYRAPITRCFFHRGAPDYVAHLLSEGAVRASGLFLPAAVAALAKKAADGPSLSETDEMALAGILSTQLLHQQFVEQSPDGGPPVGGGDDVKVCRIGIEGAADLAGIR